MNFAALIRRTGCPFLRPGVTQIVGYNHVPISVDEAEIQAIRTLVASGIPNQPCPFLEIGTRVRIESGALCGLEGVLLELKGRCRLVLSITLLQRSVAVEVDSEVVSVLPSTPRGHGCKPRGVLS